MALVRVSKNIQSADILPSGKYLKIAASGSSSFQSFTNSVAINAGTGSYLINIDGFTSASGTENGQGIALFNDDSDLVTKSGSSSAMNISGYKYMVVTANSSRNITLSFS